METFATILQASIVAGIIGGIYQVLVFANGVVSHLPM